MMRAKLLSCFVLPLLCYSTLFSQSEIARVDLFYETDADLCLPNHQRQLDSLIQTLVCHPSVYLVEVAGHTDSDGSDAYNIALSKRRANGICTYLKEKGFRSKTTFIKASGELDPIASNEEEEGKSLNRRVDVTVRLDRQPSAKIKGLTPEATVQKVNATRGDTITFSSGTVVYVPQNAFVDTYGNVVKGTVDVHFTEYRDLLDIAFSDINMMHGDLDGGTFLKSAGMFDLRVFKGNEELQFNDSTELKIDFPLTTTMPNLQFLSYNDSLRTWNSNFFITNTEGSNLPAQRARYFKERNELNTKPILKTSCRWTEIETPVRMYQIASQFTNQDTSIYRANKLILLAQKKRISLACAAEDLKVDAVNSELHEVNYQISQLDGKYTFHVIEDTKKEVEFTIAGTKKMNNVVAPFIGYSWRVKKTNTNLKKTSNRRVRLLELNPEGENATMVMFDGIDTLRFSNLEMRRLESIKFQEPYNPSEAVVEYEILVEERERLREDLQHQREALVLLRDSLVRERDWKLSETCDLTTDLIRFVGKDFTPVSCMKCVWEANLPYMSPAERSMTFETWLKHFDASKEKMSARLDSLLDTRNFRTQLDSINAFDAKYPGIFLYSPQNCGFKINEDKYELVQNTNTGKSRSTKSYDVSGLMKSFFISQPGVYNCDQVSRLKNPVLVDAEYTNGKGENFLPTRIYYLDKAAGLVLAYDGYYNLGPAHFAVSPSSDYIILAFDHESNLYKACKSDTRITKLADGSTNLQVHLTEVTKGEFEKHDKNELLSSK